MSAYKTNLKRVQPRIQVGDIHPLAVDVVSVNVRAIDRYALVAVVGARKGRFRAARALVVFQAKRSFVALRYFHAAAVQHVESGEHFHAVIVPVEHETVDDNNIIFVVPSVFSINRAKVLKRRYSSRLFVCFSFLNTSVSLPVDQATVHSRDGQVYVLYYYDQLKQTCACKVVRK